MSQDLNRPSGNFWRGVFSESDGTPSFSRVATGIMVGFACGWISCLVWRNHSLPELGGLALFITVLYGANKAAGVFSK